MQMIHEGYRGLSLVFALNLDRILFPLAIAAGLAGAAVLDTYLLELQPHDLPHVN